MNLQDFIGRVKGVGQGIAQGGQQLMAGGAQDPNSQPGALDMMSANMPDVPAQGVWGILANFAKARGNIRLSQLASAKAEQERQLKMANVQSQMDSRSSENDLRKQQVRDLMEKGDWERFGNQYKAGELNPGTDVGSPGVKTSPAIPEQDGPNPAMPKMAPISRGFNINTNPDVTAPNGQSFKPPNQPEATSRALGMASAEENIKHQNDWVHTPQGGTSFQPGTGAMIKGQPKDPSEFEQKMILMSLPNNDPRKINFLSSLDPEGAKALSMAAMRQLMETRKADEARKVQDAADLVDQAREGARKLTSIDEDSGQPQMTWNELNSFGMGKVKSKVLEELGKIDPRFSITMSDLAGKNLSSNLQNYKKADWAVSQAENNYRRMLQDIKDIHDAQKGKFGGFFGSDVGAMHADLLGRHLALVANGSGLRVGRDLLQQHAGARSWPNDIQGAIGAVTNGGFLVPQQILNFSRLGLNALNQAKQQREQFRKAPTIGPEGLTR